MQQLDYKLREYGRSDYYPFHMPGHKRQFRAEADPYQIDITEIDGFDNLHAAEGILREAQERAGRLYGSEHTFYLVNGSTCGILAAVSAAAKPGSRIVMARNMHKAMYHAVYLRQLSPVYLEPEVTEFGICGQISPEQVRRVLKAHQNENIAAVCLTSPTYEGVTSDIRAIAEIAHQYQIPLIVDEAHGAHFGFHKDFPQTAVRQGADAVIQSIHKVLPSFTQTALLHVNSAYLSEERVAEFLGIYETSSPSYILMAGMERCMRLLREDGDALFERYTGMLHRFYAKMAELKHLHVMTTQDFTPEEICGLDPSKIVVSTAGTTLTGPGLYQRLLEEYHLQMEMVSGFYVLGMTSIADTEEGFDRFAAALQEIDRDISAAEADGNTAFIRELYRPKKRELEPYEALEMDTEEVSYDSAAGRVSAGYIYLYPPGIPVIVPGEVLEEDVIADLKKCHELGLNLQGVADAGNERIKVVISENLYYTKG